MNRYLVLVMRKSAFDAALVPAHDAFLGELRERDRIELSGPFTDRSGGAYLLRADSQAEALAIAMDDPLHRAGASTITVHEWSAR